VTRNTTFTDPEDTDYESYQCHPVYEEQPKSFYSNQELKPEHYNPAVPKLSEPDVQIYEPSPFEEQELTYAPCHYDK
jgi:hypothetical protein